MDHVRCLEIQRRYLGTVNGYYTDWTPLTDRPGLFAEDLDPDDPWTSETCWCTDLDRVR